MADLLRGWPERASTAQAPQRAPVHINPIPARKPSKRAKYGWTAEKERDLASARQSTPPRSPRPRPLKGTKFFRSVIRGLTPATLEGAVRGSETEATESATSFASCSPSASPGAAVEITDGAEPADLARSLTDWHPGASAGGQQQARIAAMEEGREEQKHEESEEEQRPGRLRQSDRRGSQREQAGSPGSEPSPLLRSSPPAPGSPAGGPTGALYRNAPAATSVLPESLANTATSNGVADAVRSLTTAANDGGISGGGGTGRFWGGSGAVSRLSLGRRRLFLDGPEGPSPRTTGRIVARIAGARDWRRHLARRLLPRYLALFDQHATAYFFRHVPTLQPQPPQPSSPLGSPASFASLPSNSSALASGAPYPRLAGSAASGAGGGASSTGGGGGGSGRLDAYLREASDFRTMVVAVCCSVLPKMRSFGPRAMSLLVAGLGRMAIWHGPTMAAWEAHSPSQLGLMRPDQLVASLEGLAALQAVRPGTAAVVPVAVTARDGAGTGGGLGGQDDTGAPAAVGEGWREAALAAAAAQVPGMTVGEVGRMLQAMAALRLRPPPDLLDAACDRVRRALQQQAAQLDAEMAGLRASTSSGGAADALGSGSAGGIQVAGVTVGGVSGPGPGDGPSTRANGGRDPGGDVEWDRSWLLRVALAAPAGGEEQGAGMSSPATPGGVTTTAVRRPYGTGLVGAAAAAALRAERAERRKRKRRRKKQGTEGQSFMAGPATAAGASAATAEAAAGLQSKPLRAPPPQAPLRGADLAGVVAGLGALSHRPPAEWLSWILGSTAAVMWVQTHAGQDLQTQTQSQTQPEVQSQPSRRRRASRSKSGSAGVPSSSSDSAEAGSAGTDGVLGWTSADLAGWAADAAAAAGAGAAAEELRFFTVEDLAALAAGLAGILTMAEGPTASLDGGGGSGTAAAVSSSISVSVSSGRGTPSPVLTRQAAGRVEPAPAVPKDWLDLLCEAALRDIMRCLDPAAAEAAAAAAAAAAPTALLVQGDVTRTDSAAAAETTATVAAASAAAARVLPAASGILTALLELTRRHSYTPPAAWRDALTEMGLDLVPYMSPSSLLTWLCCLSAWRHGPGAALPPGWLAAAAVSSRANMASYTAAELCQLPVALDAAGARLPSSWAAVYVRHLAVRLAGSNAGRQDLPAAGSRRRALRDTGRRGFGRVGWRHGGRRDRTMVDGRSSWKDGARTVIPPPPLDEVATALGALVAVVPDLGYAALAEGPALEALARVFGLGPRSPEQQPAGVQPAGKAPPKQEQKQHREQQASSVLVQAGREQLGPALRGEGIGSECIGRVAAFFAGAGLCEVVPTVVPATGV